MKKILIVSIILTTIQGFGQKKLYLDVINDFQNGYAIVRKGDNVTFIDTTGTILDLDNINLKRSPNDSDVVMQKNGFFINRKQKNVSLGGGVEGIRNTKGDYVVKPKYRITVLNDYYVLKENDITDLKKAKYNILDENCNSIFKTTGSFPPRVEKPIIPLTDNIIAISSKNRPYRYQLVFPKDGRETDFVYGDFGKTKNGFIKASKYIKGDGKYKWGFLDLEGKKVIDFIYTKQPGNFGNGLAVVKNLDDKYGYINDKNEVVMEPKFIEAYGFLNKRALVRVHGFQRKNGKTNNGYRIINTKGEVIYDLEDLKPNNNRAYEYYKRTIVEQNNMLRVKNPRGKYSILNLENLELRQTDFNQINKFYSGLSLVVFYDSNRKQQKGYINKNGELVMVKAKKEF